MVTKIGGRSSRGFSHCLSIPTQRLDSPAAISENKRAGVDVGEQEEGEEAAGNAGMQTETAAPGEGGSAGSRSSKRSWGGTGLRT